MIAKDAMMSAKTADDVRGYEYDWLACDEDGYIAMFSTAGGGYAPAALLADTEAYDQAIETLQRLAATTSARLAPIVADGLPNTWKDLAERGLFSFDADASGGPYLVVGVPLIPARVNDLPLAVRDTVERIRLRGVRFAQIQMVSQEDIVRSELG